MGVKKSLVAVSAIALAGGASTLLGLPSPAWAYLLPADAIIQEIASKRARLGYDTLIAEGKRQTPGSPPVPIRWLIRANDAYRIETTNEADERTQASLTTIEGRRFETNGAGPAATRAQDDLIAAFLLSTDKAEQSNRGLGFLLAHRIDVDVVSLSRLGRRIAYVIGAKPWQTDRPQLWVDKELSVPIRLIWRDRKSGSKRDVRLLEYESPIAEGYFPARIERYENDELVETTVFRRVELNIPVDASLFRRPR